MQKKRASIPAEEVDQVLKWFDRGRVFLWIDHSLDSSPMPELTMPELTQSGERNQPDHWRYTKEPFQELTIDDIDVVGQTDLEGKTAIVRLRRYWYGFDVFEKTKIRLDRLAKRLGANVLWDCEGIGDGKARIVFFAQKIVPLSSYAKTKDRQLDAAQQDRETDCSGGVSGPANFVARTPTGCGPIGDEETQKL